MFPDVCWIWWLVGRCQEQESRISTLGPNFWKNSGYLETYICILQTNFNQNGFWFLPGEGSCCQSFHTLWSTIMFSPQTSHYHLSRQGWKQNETHDYRGENIRRVLWNLKHLNQQWTNSVLCDLCSKLVHILGYLNGRLKPPIFLWPVDVSGTYVLLAWPLCILYQ